MKYIGSALVALVGAIALTVTGASAAVVCNEAGDCWRVTEKHDYPPEANLSIYADDWEWDDAHADKYRWRDPGQGRGYWRQGVWIEF